VTTLVPYLTFHHGGESLRFLVEALGFEENLMTVAVAEPYHLVFD